ncbi:MAG TPA: HDOD domain-containing protein [Planctomycetota bacterium]|nr:HDOD domain-containing protein [Planctomycetota bacterium]
MPAPPEPRRGAAPEAPAEPAAGWWSPKPADAGQPPPPPPTLQESALAARLERLVALGRFSIPQVPPVVVDAMNLLARPDSAIKDIADVVARDQRLAADMLSFSNSSLFAGAAKATNLTQALMRIGFRRARGVVLSACLKGAVYSGVEIRRAERLWRHACCTAAAASRIAANAGLDPDDLYVCGLFHDVGKIVVLSLVDDLAVRATPSPLSSATLEALIETHHERTGAEVALQWSLPDDVVDVVQNHDADGGERLSAAQAAVAIADRCCRRLGAGAADFESDDGGPVAGEDALRALGADPERPDAALEGVREVVQEMIRRTS